MPEEDHRSQIISLVLVVLGMIATGIADKYNLRDLANAGTTAIGLGGGILTGQKLQSLTAQKGGQVNLNPTDPKVTS